MPTDDAQGITVNRIKQIHCQRCGTQVDISRAKPLSVMACPQCGAEVRVPAQIDHFLLVRKLAAGSSGAVYVAYDENLWRQVALKLVYKSPRSGEDRTQECLREARALAMINHRHVVQVYSFSEDLGQPFIVMELVDGGRLDELIRQGPLAEDRALTIGRGAAEGLAAAHRLRVVHGDVKPENILLDREGHAKLIDFGLAVRTRREAEPGSVRGSPYYIAPEVARGEAPGPQSDQYNLGATLYRCVTGLPPFPGSEVREVITQRLKVPPPDPRRRRPQLHPGTAAIIQRMMATDPAQRYESLLACCAALEEQWRLVTNRSEAAAS